MMFNFKNLFSKKLFLKRRYVSVSKLKALSISKILTEFFLILVLFLSILFPAAGLCEDNEKAYNSKRQPYNNFMKCMQQLTKKDFECVDKISQLLEKSELKKEELEQVTVCGRMIYEKYKTDIDSLIKNYDRLIDEKNPMPSDKQYLAARSSSAIIDFRYTRSLARALAAVSRWLESEKRFDDSLKLSTLSWRFGQIILNGDGGVSSLIMAMIGIAIKNIPAQNHLCAILNAGDFKAEFYQKYSKRLFELNEDEMDMAAVIECERRTFINVLEYEVYVKNNIKNEYSEIVKKIPDGYLEEGKKYTVGIFNAYYDSVSVFLTKYKNEPYIVKDRFTAMMREITKNGEPSLGQLLNPVKAVGDILLSIAAPNFSRSHEQFLRAKYYSYGAAICARTLAEIKKGATPPVSLEALEKLCGIKLPPDVFDKNRKPLKYKKTNENFTLYSNGNDYKDDGADAIKDIVLLKIPVLMK